MNNTLNTPAPLQASQAKAQEIKLLDTPEKLQAMRDFARSSGGWDESEVNAWNENEVNALFLQLHRLRL